MPSFTAPFTLTASSAVFIDDFNTLSLFNTRNPSAGGTWEPAFWYASDGSTLNDSWILNPFNPATPIGGVYVLANNAANLTVIQTPAQFAAACSNQPQVGAIMTTRESFRQLHGYFEARFKLSPKLHGLGAAFFLMQDLTWPPELDIIEIITPGGNQVDVGVYTVWAMDGTIAATNWTFNGTNPGPNWNPGEFHSYGVDWTASTITWYIDRLPVFSAPTPAGYTEALFPILEYNSGGDFAGSMDHPEQLPAAMIVDYVAIWTTRPF